MPLIENQDSVVDYFGYWPEFCDGKIREYSENSDGSISMLIHYMDCDQDKKALVRFEFLGVSENKLSPFGLDNVIDRLSISNSNPHSVDLEGCVGLDGTFKCIGVKTTINA